MQKDRPITYYFPHFIKREQRRGLSSSTLSKRKRHLHFFKKWLEKEGLADLPPENLQKGDLLKYKKYLSGEKKKNARPEYQKTVYFLLQYLQSRNIPCPALAEKESDIQRIVNHYFYTKGYSLRNIKENARKKKIIYSRYTKPARDLLELAGSVEKAKKAIDKVAAWANSRNLDYAIETVFKKWPELDKLKPKEKKLKPYFYDDPMVWSKTKQKWYVIDKDGEWLEFAGDEKQIIWKKEEE